MASSVLLPVSAAPQAAVERSILLIEDEPSIARMLTRLFTQAGLRVLSAVDPGESMQVVGRNLDNIALAFVDFHGDGRESAEFCLWVRSIRPNLPVLLATARNQTVCAISGPTLMLPRPYLPTEVVAKVRDILTRAGV